MTFEYKQMYKDTEKLLRFMIDHEFEEDEVINLAILSNEKYSLEFNVFEDVNLKVYTYRLWIKDTDGGWSDYGCIEYPDKFPKNIKFSMTRAINKGIKEYTEEKQNESK